MSAEDEASPSGARVKALYEGLNAQLKKHADRLDKPLRALQRAYFKCAGECSDDVRPTEAVTACIAQCHRPMVEAQGLVSHAVQAFQKRVERCQEVCGGCRRAARVLGGGSGVDNASMRVYEAANGGSVVVGGSFHKAPARSPPPSHPPPHPQIAGESIDELASGSSSSAREAERAKYLKALEPCAAREGEKLAGLFDPVAAALPVALRDIEGVHAAPKRKGTLW